MASVLGARLVIEFVAPDDQMVQRLRANKPPGQHDDYRQDVFDRLLATDFTIERRQPLPSGTRTMYLAVPHA